MPLTKMFTHRQIYLRMIAVPMQINSSKCGAQISKRVLLTLTSSQSYKSPLSKSYGYSTQTSQGSLHAKHKGCVNEYVYSLTPEEREELLAALTKASNAEKLAEEQKANAIQSPTFAQLRYVALFSGIPFVGFGILDNTFMLIAGEYIDLYFGAMLGITTMAAAALGNLVSDVLGITTAGFVEQTALKMGLKAPSVTLEQMSLRRARWSANLGRSIGVCIGCLLGMWPLLVFTKDEKDEKKQR